MKWITKMSNLKSNISLVLWGVVIGVVLVILLNKGCGKPTKTNIKTVTTHTTDTIIKIDTIRQTIYKPFKVVIDSGKKIKCDTNYYNMTFKDSNYLVTTYGGKVDSIYTEVKLKEVRIIDSIKTFTTLTEYKYPNNLYLSANLNYGLDKSFSPEIMVSGNIKNILLNLGVGYNLNNINKGLFIKAGIGVKLNKNK